MRWVILSLLKRHTILLTFHPQMSYIWDSPSSVVKYLFIGNRYANLLVQPLYSFEVAGVIPLDSSTVSAIPYVIIQVVDSLIDRPVLPSLGRWLCSKFGLTALCIVRPIMVWWQPMQIEISVLVLLRLWIVYGRTLKITIALTTAFILYLCTIIALIAYIISSINCKLNCATKIV